MPLFAFVDYLFRLLLSFRLIWHESKKRKKKSKIWKSKSERFILPRISISIQFQFNFSADQGSYIKYFLWVFMIVTQFQHHCNQYVSAVFMHSDSERIFNETAILAACSNSSSVFFILFVIIQILPSNDWRETYFKNDGICWWYTLDSIYLNF